MKAWIVIGLLLAVVGCDPHSVINRSDDGRYCTDSGSFCIQFDRRPDYALQDWRIGNQEFRAHQFRVITPNYNNPETIYSIAYLDFPPGEGSLNKAKSYVYSRDFNNHPSVRGAPVVAGGHDGWSAAFTSERNDTRIRMFVNGDRFYFVKMVSLKPIPAEAEEAFFGSFSILPMQAE